MIVYRLFHSVVAGLDDDAITDLAIRAGVPVAAIRAYADGTHRAGLGDRYRLGEALRMNPLDLFALDADMASALPPTTFVDDPATLAAIDRLAS